MLRQALVVILVKTPWCSGWLVCCITTTKCALGRTSEGISFAKQGGVWCNGGNFPIRRLARDRRGHVSAAPTTPSAPSS